MLQEGFQNLISHDRISDLGRLHDLCVRVGAKKAVIAAFKSYVRNSGSEIVTDDSKAKEMIQSLLHLKARMDAVVAGAFHDNKDFNNSLRDAFETFMNRRAGRTAELLAKHLDGVLRGGGKSSLPAADAGGPTQEDQQEAAVDAALVLFRFLQVCICICLVGLFFGLCVCVCGGGGGRLGRSLCCETKINRWLEEAFWAPLVSWKSNSYFFCTYAWLQGKDVFEAFYKQDLARRLLLGRSLSLDAEKLAVSKLKAECGSQFTSKLEGMFADIDLSKEAMAGFKQSSASIKALVAACPGVDLSVQVLTSGFWPTYPMVDLNLPPGIAAAQKTFADYYLTKHSGRHLAWVNSLGTAIVRAKFDAGTKELVVSAFQAAVLLQFNDGNGLSFRDILLATGIPQKELQRTLQSLACGRERILTKNPKGREVDENDSFEVNRAYTSRLYRVRVNTIQLKESSEENRKTNETVMQDRQYQIDAAIVRIMKTRKTLSHKLLVSELIQQLRFPVEAVELKKRVESLLDREYLERDPDDPKIYNYLAWSHVL